HTRAFTSFERTRCARSSLRSLPPTLTPVSILPGGPNKRTRNVGNGRPPFCGRASASLWTRTSAKRGNEAHFSTLHGGRECGSCSFRASAARKSFGNGYKHGAVMCPTRIGRCTSNWPANGRCWWRSHVLICERSIRTKENRKCLRKRLPCYEL